MLSFTKKTEYALISLCYLADEPARTISAREIAEAYRMPTALVMNILKTLHHSGLISSTRGTKGGYRLQADLSEVSLRRLIGILEGPVRLAECVEPGCQTTPGALEEPCKIASGCPIQGPIQALHAKLVSFLDEVNVADLVVSGQRIDVPLGRVGTRKEASPDLYCCPVTA